MPIMSLIVHAFLSRETGMCVQVCSRGSLIVNWKSTTIGVISQLFICLWTVDMWEKPTVPPSWGNEEVEWEAKAMRQADAAKARAASAASAEVRAQIQEEIAATKKQRRQAIRQQEKAQQFDRQREEIHPAHVLEVLGSLAPPERESLHVPKAVPDPERTTSSQPLVIGYREKAVD